MARKISFGFEPGDIVSEVMSFGSPTPVEVMVVGPDLAAVRKHALRGPRRDEEDPQPPRRAAFPATRLPDRAGEHRPRESGPQRRVGQGRHRRALGGHVFQPLRGQELLARPAQRGRLPGPSPGPPAAHGPAATDGDVAPAKGQQQQQLDGPRRGHRADRRGARRDRPQFHAALPEHHGQCRGRGPGPGVGANRQGHRRCRPAAARRAGQGPRPGRAHDGDVPVRWPSAWSCRSW